jgi:hypothetical protein
MKSLAVGSYLALAFALAGCASPDEAKVDDSLAAYVLSDVPTDVQYRSLVDFGGAVQLVGWDLSPAERAAPGSSLRLKLYWRSTKKLSPGWKLFTHVISADAPKPYAFDDLGTLREKLPPSEWTPGRVYVDEQEFIVPSAIGAPEITLAVGVGHEAVQVAGSEIDGLSGTRLEVLSGLADDRNRAVIARLATGVTPGQKSEPRGERRRPGDRRPGPAGAGRERPTRPQPQGMMPGRMPQNPNAGPDLKEKP